MTEIEKELRHYLEGDVAPRAALEWSRETSAAMVDLKFCDLLGTWQHSRFRSTGSTRRPSTDGLGFDGSSIRGWQGISEIRHAADARPSTAMLDPFTRGSDTLARLRRCRSAHARAVRRIRAIVAQARRGVPADDRHRRHLLLGAGGEFFVFDRSLTTSGQNAAHY